MVDHITRRLRPDSNPGRQVESSCTVYTLTHFRSTFRVAVGDTTSGESGKTDAGDHRGRLQFGIRNQQERDMGSNEV